MKLTSHTNQPNFITYQQQNWWDRSGLTLYKVANPSKGGVKFEILIKLN
jgi:hypothetical protein